MPTKRYHKKSRAGCNTCKRRRVKCDEATPICGTCAQRQDLCSYSHKIVTTARPRGIATTTTTTSSSSSSSPTSIDCTSNVLFDACNGSTSRLGPYNATRMKEMQLMHQWSTDTYLTTSPRNMEVFRDYAVSQALEYSYLMDILLALTSLHSATKATGAMDAYEHVTAALHYQNQSIADLNKDQALIRITQEACEPLVLVTALNMICTLMASLVPVTPGEQLESMPQVMLRVRRCMLGLNEVIDQCRFWTQDSKLARIFKSPTVPNIQDGGWLTAEKMRILSNTILANIDLCDAATPFFRGSLEKLEKAYADNNGRSVFGWLVMIEAEFFHKVDLGEAAAMVILACWGALTFALEEVWWTKYAGRRIVEDLSIRLSGCDRRWNEILQWCYEQVGILSDA